MIKKIILTCLLTSMFASWGYATYRFFTPEVAPTIYQSSMLESTQEKNNSIIMLTPVTTAKTMDVKAEADASIDTQDENRKVVYYCNQENQDCGFLDSQVLSQIDRELGNTLFNSIQYVDVATLEVQSANKRKSEYGFSNYPAFVIYEKNEDGTYINTQCLQYNSSAPWTIEQVKAWLVEHEVVSFE